MIAQLPIGFTSKPPEPNNQIFQMIADRLKNSAVPEISRPVSPTDAINMRRPNSPFGSDQTMMDIIAQRNRYADSPTDQPKYRTPKPTPTGDRNLIYHNSADRHLESIASEGLSKDYAGEYPHGIKERPDLDTKKMIYFSDVEGRAKEFGGNGLIIRVNKSDLNPSEIYDFPSFKNTETRYWGNNIPPEKMEVKVNGDWIPLIDYAQSKGIKPLK